MREFQTEQFKGTDRFAVERRIGAGGMGVVYRAFDRQRNEIVAIKTLRSVEPAAIYRLKREFRAIADLVHPNFVKLYELFSSEGEWFFTMEFVEGTDFLQYVRCGKPCSPPVAHPQSHSTNAFFATESSPKYDTGPGDARFAETVLSFPQPVPDRQPDGTMPPFSPEFNARLRSTLHQLAVALCALHDAGKLHRDLKPSNVLVERGGRVVLLDFGLATEVWRSGIDVTSKSHVLGTAPYMSPEQGAAKELTAASDWYSVGAMIYEVLAGRVPFLGPPVQILVDKQQHDPSPPATLDPEVPEDLNDLCMALLSRDPAARPSGAKVIRRLGAAPTAPAEDTVPASPRRDPTPFVGRSEQLSELNDAFSCVEDRGTVVVHVHGRSGIGKSALVEQFLKTIAGKDGTVVLAGRCHDRESVPFRALDSLMDALTRYLLHLSPLEVDALMPRDVVALACVFPVLCRVEAFDQVCEHSRQIPDRQELRQRAFVALRELLARLGDRKTLVLCIDDLQWGDLDSVALLDELLQPPAPPRLLLLMCYRSEERAANPVVRAVLEAQFTNGEGIDSRQMEVLPLPQNVARKLALALLGDADAATRRLCDVVARESRGNPYFIDALVREQRTEKTLPDRQARSQPVDLDEMLWARAQRLPTDARRVLEVVAVAGRPLQEADACQAAQLAVDVRETLAVLRATSMIRVTGGPRGDEIETYHDRIRETVVAHLPNETLVHHHRRLAKVLEASGQADPAVLAGHFLRAGERERAGAHFADAALKSAETLAFDRAAQLYRRAVDLCRHGTAGERELRRNLADALSNAGRGAEAAKEYLTVATGATAAESLELRRCAAMQSLISGHIDEGLAALRTVLRAAGVKYPATSRRAFWSLLLRRAMIRLRGLRFRQRDPSQVAADKLSKIDVCWSATIGLSVVDPIRGADFQARGLLLALQAGEPNRIFRSLATEAGHVATAGGRTRRRVERLLAKANALAEQLDSEYAEGFNLLVHGIAAFLQGRWRRSLECSDRAETTFRNHCTGVAWELNTAQIFAEWSLFWMGEVVEMARRLPLQFAEARKRGNLYALTTLGTFAGPLVSLAADNPDAAHEELSELMGRWSRRGLHVQHNTYILGQTQIDIYRGRSRAARQRLVEHWPALAGSLLLRVQQVRIYMRHLHARAVLAEAEDAAHVRPLLRIARSDARKLERENMDWATALAQLVRAGITAMEADRSRTITLLDDAVSRLDEVDMHLFAAAARRRLGELMGGESGRELVARGDSWMAAQGVQNPERMTAMHVPGIRGRR